MVSNKNLHIRLIALECHITEENDGDEIFLKVNEEKIWPLADKYFPLTTGSAHIGLEIETNTSTSLEVELWEYDTFNPNDKLGYFQLLLDDKGGPYRTDLQKANSSFARYTLVWETF